MSGWFVLMAYLAAVNPPRIQAGLAAGEDRGQLRQLATAALLVVGVGLGLVLAADMVLDTLDITDETWRLASGIICLLVGAKVLTSPQLAELPSLANPAIVPMAFPLLITPQLAALAILFGATETLPVAWGWLAASVGSGVAVGALSRRHPELWHAATRLLAAVLVIVGVALIVAGIRDV